MATTRAIIVNNLDWIGEMGAIDWLRDIGKHFSVSRMLAKEAVSARLEAGGISYTEFSYQVMQAVDYLELYRRHGVHAPAWRATSGGTSPPAWTSSAGSRGPRSMPWPRRSSPGPTARSSARATGSTLWLDPELTTPFAFYQWFVNTDDSVVGTYLRVFSFRRARPRSRRSRRPPPRAPTRARRSARWPPR